MARRIAQVARPCLRQLRAELQHSWTSPLASFSTSSQSQYATATPAAAASKLSGSLHLPVAQSPPSKPPSARPAETRKSQLIRTYTSLLRSTPLILFFQHSNLTAVEWSAVRRELRKVLQAVPPPAPIAGVEPLDVTSRVKIEVLRTNMLNVALRIVEFFNPEVAAASASTPRTSKGALVHDLSEAAYEATRNMEIPPDSEYAQIEPLLVGPLAALVIPAVSPQHLAAALSVLAPVPGKFPAPKKSKSPGYHDPICQNGLSKLLLVGGRIEGQIFDQAGVQWVGGIENGLEGLRAQLVHVLQSAGLGLTTSLEGHSKSLWLTLESRKSQLEDESGEKKTE